MPERRRADRIRFADGIPGVMSLRQDVVIERVSEAELVVLSDALVPRGDQISLEVEADEGVSETCVTRVAERHPALVNGRACHRLHLRVQASARAGLSARWLAIQTPAPAVTIRRLDVRLMNVSPKGCLVRTSHALSEGMVGLLDVSVDGHTYGDAVHISRATAVAGGVGYRAAGQFLSLSPPSIRSVRWLAGWLGHSPLVPAPRAKAAAWAAR